MALLAIVVSLAMPSLGGFFRGRNLDSEARRLLALARHGQSRAVSEGVPMLLWVDAPQRAYGLEEEPGWVDKDAKAVAFTLGPDLQLEVVHPTTPQRATARSLMTGSVQARPNPRNLPEIRFLPDGSFDETSPLALRLFDRDGVSLWVAQATNRLTYEIRNQYN